MGIVTCILKTESGPILRVRAVLDATPPTLSEGYGGVNVVSRPRDTALTEYGGTSPMKLTLSLILDGLAARDDQSDFRANLNRMFRPMGETKKTLPLLSVECAVIEPEWTKAKWLPSNLTWGSNVVRSGAGNILLRQDFVIELIEAIRDERLQRLTPANKAREIYGQVVGSVVTAKTHRVKKGETLRAVAAIALNNPDEWPKIARQNDIRDPKSVKEGDLLRIP